ncbi:MAG: NAD(P)/FAD-dependent oxidoreductase [Actinomycetota bacterium]|nr:NAD(P)/FAD-dependent oxidoreductase [Actinomycetota bacterium]
MEAGTAVPRLAVRRVNRPQVVIVGAGFAGLDCAKALAGHALDVTVIDRHNYHTFQPLLYQVATSGLAPSDVAYPVRGIFRRTRNVTFRHGVVDGVDWERREVWLRAGPRLGFDYLVVAAGAATNWFGVRGAEEHTFALYRLEDAIRARNHVLGQFEAAAWEQVGDGATEGRLTFVIVGGGATGVEMAGALRELFDHVLAKDFRRLNQFRARIVLLEMSDTVLAPFSRKAREHARRQLQRRGVDVRLRATVAEVTDAGVTLTSGERISARTVIWAAGVRANGLAGRLEVEQTRAGRIVVAPDLSIPGRRGAFAVGDIAAIPQEEGAILPQLAPVAKQSGAFVGQRILALIAGDEPSQFRYRDRGTMATVGRNAAVADLPLGVRLTGRSAWYAWLLLHLLWLAGFRNRLSVLLDWAWSFLTYDRGPRVIVGEATPGRDCSRS